jgi:hypothetical protein
VTTPTVHEFPIAATTHPAPLHRYGADVLGRMEQMLRERPCLRDDERASLSLIGRELSRRRGCEAFRAATT